MASKDETTSTHLPPSFQAPRSKTILETAYSANTCIDSNLAADIDLTSKSPLTRAEHNIDTAASKKQSTTASTQTSPTTSKTANDLPNTLNHLRNDSETAALTLSETTSQGLQAALSDLASSHQQRLGMLAASMSTLDHNVADIVLDFTDATGSDKGSATLGERMRYFEARVCEIRACVQDLLRERLAVEEGIERVRRELDELVADDVGGYNG